jgi:hypothetical protein
MSTDQELYDAMSEKSPPPAIHPEADARLRSLEARMDQVEERGREALRAPTPANLAALAWFLLGVVAAVIIAAAIYLFRSKPGPATAPAPLPEGPERKPIGFAAAMKPPAQTSGEVAKK